MKTPREIVLIPVKNFDIAKSRLRHHLADDQLLDLIQSLAVAVIRASAPRACAVLCDSDEVAEFAATLKVDVWRVSPAGLNEAVSEGYALAGAHFDRAIIAHGDLARPDGLGSFTFNDGVTIVTDRHALGTNVLALPTRTAFHFAYGENSAQHHQRESRRCGLAVNIVTESPWSLDIDGPEDLEFAQK